MSALSQCHKCPHCPRIFVSKESLQEHTPEHDNDEPTVHVEVDENKDENGLPKTGPGSALHKFLARSLGISLDVPEKLLDEISLEGVGRYIKSGKCKNIITMAGAGISTSAGIPDFQNPGTDLYKKLQEYNLPNPRAASDIEYFKKNPEPFFHIAKDRWPGNFKPTPCHHFIKMLQDKGLLLRHYTQNVDTLEREVGITGEKIVEAHGSFNTSHCLTCKKEYSQKWMRDMLFQDKIPRCPNGCGGLIKPDIVFFGEPLPERYYDLKSEDFPKCDLLIIMGTALVVQPFASLMSSVPDTCPRLYINMEIGRAGSKHPITALMFGGGFEFALETNYRDVYWQGKCDDGCYALADIIGWKEELVKIVEEKNGTDKKASGSPKPTSRLSDKPTSKSTSQIAGQQAVRPRSQSGSPGRSPQSATKQSLKNARSASNSPLTVQNGSSSPRSSTKPGSAKAGKSGDKKMPNSKAAASEKDKLQDDDIEDDYTGPRLENGKVTLQFVLDLMEAYKDQKKLHRKYADQVIQDVTELLNKEETLVDITVPKGSKLTVCGDIHGQFFDLMNLFKLNGLPSKSNPYLFNGDFVDRGIYSVECILTLFSFKLLYPDHFHLTRGNHESVEMNEMFGFRAEVEKKYSINMMVLFGAAFNALPLAFLINKKVLVMHGGLFTEDGVTLEDIRNIDRKREPPTTDTEATCIMVDLLWSDPQPAYGRAPSHRSQGTMFGPDITKAFLEQNNLDYIIRSHEEKTEGYEVGHDGKCVTIFSAPNYCDALGNLGAFLTVTGDDLTPKFTSYESVPHPNITLGIAEYGNNPFFGLL